MRTQMTSVEREEFAVLLTQAVDGELGTDDQAKFDQYLNDYEECRVEWDEFRKLKEVTQTMKLKSPSQEVWDDYWVSIYRRLERGVAWVLFSIGCIIVLSYGGFKAVEALVNDPEMATILKTGILLMLGGLSALLVSVVREKFTIRKSDPYKEIVR